MQSIFTPFTRVGLVGSFLSNIKLIPFQEKTMSDSESGPEEVPITKKGHGKNRQIMTRKNTKPTPMKHRKTSTNSKNARKLQLQPQIKKKTKWRSSSSEDESETEQETEKQVKNEAMLLARASKKPRLMAENVESDSDEESDLESPLSHQKTANNEKLESSEEDSGNEGEESMASGSDEEDVLSNSEQQEGSGDNLLGDEESDSSNSSEEEGEDEGNDVTEKEDTTEDIDKGYAALRNELSNMPFDELQQLKEKIGIKLYNQVMFSQVSTSNTGKAGSKRFKRENKNRPMEVSSKRRPGRIRNVIPVKKRLVRDPRFDDLSGEYKEDIFKSTYSFLGDVKKNEKQKLLKQLNKEKDDDKKEQLEYLVRRMTAQEKAERNKDQQKERDRQRKKQEKVLVSEGKQPFYLKKSDKKKLELAEKYRELQKSGKVDTYLSKKRKKNAQKERRNLPAKQ